MLGTWSVLGMFESNESVNLKTVVALPYTHSLLLALKPNVAATLEDLGTLWLL